MNKSTLLGLALAMLVPTVALADGVSVGGDMRLRWDYAGPETSASSNSSSAVTNIDLGAAINDNVSFTASLRHDFAFGEAAGPGNHPAPWIQEAYASVGDLGSASGMLAGWSLEVGRMNNPDGGRIINADDWAQDAGPATNDGYHLASNMGGVGIDIWYFGGGSSPAGSADSMLGAAFDLGDMGGFADIGIAYWSASAGTDPSNLGISLDNIAGDTLAGVDLDVDYATRDNDTGGDDGTLTSISLGYAMEGIDLHFSNTVADADWDAFSDAAHGTNGIADMNVGSNAAGADVENTTIGASFSPMDGVSATVNFITLAEDTSGDDIGTEVDLILDWECGSDVTMTIGYASFSADDASLLEDCDYVYLQTGWDF